MLNEIAIVLYNMAPQNVKKSWTKIYAKIATRSHAYKDYASSYNLDIFNSFNPELQLKYTESAVRNKLIDLLSEGRVFKFVATLVIRKKAYC